MAIIAFGLPTELPSEVDGVTIVARRPHRRRVGYVGKFVETFQYLAGAVADAIAHDRLSRRRASSWA